MLAQFSAVEVLVMVLCVGLIAALFGRVGGAGAARALRIRMTLLEDSHAGLSALVNRYKGARGQEVAKEQREKLTKREQEAEALAAKLGHRRDPLGNRWEPLGIFPPRAITEQELEDAQLAQLEKEGVARGLKKGAG